MIFRLIIRAFPHFHAAISQLGTILEKLSASALQEGLEGYWIRIAQTPLCKVVLKSL